MALVKAISKHGNSAGIILERTILKRVGLADGPAVVACEVRAMTDHAVALGVIPLAAPEQGFVELFCTATSALERHADITEQLRDAGWHSDRMTALAS